MIDPTIGGLVNCALLVVSPPSRNALKVSASPYAGQIVAVLVA